MVVSESCVLCGHCVTACPAGAKRVRDDQARARQLLRLKDRVIVSLAPSFASEFAGVSPERLVDAIRKLGVFGVSETALGADLVSAQIAADFAEEAERAERNADYRRRKLYLSSACPTTVEYIKRYISAFSPYITDRASPLLAHARYLRSIYGADIGIIFVGPCIAKKREADVWPVIDCAITFRDLRRWLADAGISLAPECGDHDAAVSGTNVTAAGFIPHRAAKGALYPIDGGMIAAVKKYPGAEGVFMMSVTGLDEIDAALSGLDPETLETPLFIELLACPGGCVNGPQGTSGGPTALRRINLLEYAQRARDTVEERLPEISGTIPVSLTEGKRHSDEEIIQGLRQVGKIAVQDELNCGSCGYDTCRGFVGAMLEHRAEKTMCVSYMRKLAQKKANGLIKAIPSGVVICDSNMKIIECNENFARLMGEDTSMMFEAKPGLEGADLAKITSMSRFFTDVMAEEGPDAVEHEIREGKKIFHATVFSIEKGESACGVIQDVTAPQIQKDRVIKQTQRVINKNLAVVQKIAFLLGENAAETEATLNSIIESFTESDEDDA
jgi:iron only hydrogenase large subunit-like protein